GDSCRLKNMPTQFGQGEGAFVFCTEHIDQTAAASPYYLSDGNDCRYVYRPGTAGKGLSAHDGSNSINYGGSDMTQQSSLCVTWNDSKYKTLSKGGTVKSSSHTGNFDSATKLDLFKGPGASGVIQKLIYIHRYLSDVEMNEVLP